MYRAKSLSRVLSVLTVMLLLLAALLSCSGGVTREEAQTASESLFAALSEGDYEAAAALFHPDTDTTADILASYCEGLASERGIDLSKGATIERYTGMSSSLYDSGVGGSRYELTMKVKVGETTATFRVEVVRNDSGFGIANLHCDS